MRLVIKRRNSKNGIFVSPDSWEKYKFAVAVRDRIKNDEEIDAEKKQLAFEAIDEFIRQLGIE